MPEATTHQDQYGRHGEPDPSIWQEAEAVTGRPNDEAPANSTLAERAKAKVGAKQVDADDEKTENKAVTSASKKAPAKKAAAKKKG